MLTVKSKYKNPDKYIERLREEYRASLETTRYYSDECKRLQGRDWFSYQDGVTKEVTHTTKELMGAKLNQPIIILGRIVGYTREGIDKHRITISIKNVALKD